MYPDHYIRDHEVPDEQHVPGRDQRSSSHRFPRRYQIRVLLVLTLFGLYLLAATPGAGKGDTLSAHSDVSGHALVHTGVVAGPVVFPDVGHSPVGHFLLRWRGPRDARVMNYIDVTKTAYLEAGATRAGYRRKGVAKALNREAERLARAKGCTQIGLEVASTDNPEAKQLYEHLGYIDRGQGEFLISWEYIDTHSNQVTESEVVTSMHKGL